MFEKSKDYFYYGKDVNGEEFSGCLSIKNFPVWNIVDYILSDYPGGIIITLNRLN